MWISQTNMDDVQHNEESEVNNKALQDEIDQVEDRPTRQRIETTIAFQGFRCRLAVK